MPYPYDSLMINRQALRSYMKRYPRALESMPSSRSSVPVHQGCWDIPGLARAYGLPHRQAGIGRIGIGELGGEYYPGDTRMAFTAMGLPMPHVSMVSVDGTGPSPSDADGEVALDVQVAAAVYSCMTGKAAHVTLYYAADIAPATRRAAADGCRVMSWSWGADESVWGKAALDDMEQAAAEATAAGTTVTAASGDNSADDGGGVAGVDAPSSCPHVLACGGTSKAHAETVWGTANANGEGTGGGFSAHFPMQAWQIGSPMPPPNSLGRMVPDVAGVADPATGIMVYLGNYRGWQPIGGTSAQAPMWAGIIAACATGPLGFVNSAFWSDHACFQSNVAGENGPLPYQKQPPTPGPCTGLGPPVGAKLATLIASLKHASGA